MKQKVSEIITFLKVFALQKKSDIIMQVVYMLPYEVIYWATIRSGSIASVEVYPNKEVGSLTIFDLLSALDGKGK